ncbi:stalk domain-containing protein [Aneurinibacillus uraniidurans]|uniref:stalk domain-containing protein n=1 Tax=Aneurinibacillus uraniidurans TaxID=2966586 RepID=UPI00234B67A0|nr:stalk domain-containing protein [Aneurinibacillus sp. B1]WCN36600.1 stalk domain-containing protein [Aneurinibacillus sp. B1]
MKRIVSLSVATLSLSLLFSPVSPAFAAQLQKEKVTVTATAPAYKVATINLTFEGEPFTISKQPVMIGKTLMLPAKDFYDEFDIKVKWDAKNNTMTMIDGDVTANFKVGSKIGTFHDPSDEVSDYEFEMDVAPVIINGTLYVEAETVIASIYCVVDWTDVNTLDISNYNGDDEYDTSSGDDEAYDISDESGYDV